MGKFRHAKAEYFYDLATNSIYKGTSSIKGLNAGYSDFLYSLKDNSYKTFTDLLYDIQASGMPRDQVETLIKLDYFSEFGTIGTLLRTVEMYNAYGGKKIIKKDKCKLPMEILTKYCTETEKQWRVQDTDLFITELCSMIPSNCTVPMQSIFTWQSEYLGYICYKDESKKDIGYVMDVNCRYSPKIQIYQLWDGKTATYKVQKRAYEKNPFDKGCFLNFHWEQRPKSKLVDGQWQKDYSITEKWLTNYLINAQLPS